MKNLEKKFNIYFQKYFARKNIFEKFVENSTGKMKDRSKELLDLLQNSASELKEVFSNAATASYLEIRKKVSQFKEAYKEMNEIRKPIWRQWFETLIVVLPLVFILRNFVFGLYHVPTGSAEKTVLVGDRLWGNKFIYFFKDIKRGEYVILDNPLFYYEKNNPIKYFWQRYIGFGLPVLGLPNGPDNWLKHVIAIPGDTIEGRVENGKTVVYLNGKKLDEPYINPYPLIRLIKTTGIFDINANLGLFNFLKQNKTLVDYTYLPNVDLDKQPYYNMTKDEIYHDPVTWQPVLKKPYTPSLNEYGQNIDLFGPIKVPDGKYWVMGDSRKNSQDSRFWGFLDKSLIHGRASFIIYSIDSEEPFWLLELLKHPIDFWTKYFRWNRSFKFLNNKEIGS